MRRVVDCALDAMANLYHRVRWSRAWRSFGQYMWLRRVRRRSS